MSLQFFKIIIMFVDNVSESLILFFRLSQVLELTPTADFHPDQPLPDPLTVVLALRQAGPQFSDLRFKISSKRFEFRLDFLGRLRRPGAEGDRKKIVKDAGR